jgi:FkbM family methyltransferase
MLQLGKVKNAARRAIGKHRRSMPIMLLHEAASFVESAYANEGSDFHTNGESFLLQRLSGCGFRVAFDIGANVGDWTLAALEAWPACHCHAFEVASPTFQALSDRVSRSPHAARATMHCLGASDDAGEQEMYYFPDHPELTCDLPRHEHHRVPMQGRMVRLDDYAAENAVDSVDFLKIDVEGAEHRVLRGFSNWIGKQRVGCIQFEYGAFSTQTRFLLADYYELLGQLYWIGKIYPSYVDFQDYVWTMEDFRFANYCCVSKAQPSLKAILAA